MSPTSSPTLKTPLSPPGLVIQAIPLSVLAVPFLSLVDPTPYGSLRPILVFHLPAPPPLVVSLAPSLPWLVVATVPSRKLESYVLLYDPSVASVSAVMADGYFA
jgi:hypothetical protein